MKQPNFWYFDEPNLLAKLLYPVSIIFFLLGRISQLFVKPWKAPIPVICIGNLVVGGSGKTPTAIALAAVLKSKGWKPHFLTRGYGGTTTEPLLVNIENHSSDIVGDEALLLAEISPTWVSSNRTKSAKLAIENGANILILDDGFQNASIQKDLSILVIDGEVGFGNKYLLPAGPLRENIAKGLKRSNAALILGNDTKMITDHILKHKGKEFPMLGGSIEPAGIKPQFFEKKFVAFSGIGRPKKFFDTLDKIGLDIIRTFSFDDHHPYSRDELINLSTYAERHGAELITTSKDRRRINANIKLAINELPIYIKWRKTSELDKFLDYLEDISLDTKT
ncbi:MAG: Tetraacyldisaccharide 4'-kinase [Alphaproteobacteria bacterium MarineAlpha3_Bin7]|nr:MAG: Tetraacyldisaccharide 4'-kinase [Alphaproteobacteria bacterium MarineAlpha3_Bin7]